MAKRTQASRSAHRPGGQGPSRKKTSGAEAGSSTADEAKASSTEEIGASYSEVQVDEVAAAAVAAASSTQVAEEPTSGRRSRRRARGRSSTKKSRDDLASRAAAEDVWVRDDLRRIAIVSVILVAALALAYLVFGVMDVLSLY